MESVRLGKEFDQIPSGLVIIGDDIVSLQKVGEKLFESVSSGI